MQRQRIYTQHDDAPLPESGDSAFVGMDMRAPALVEPGFAASVKNKRLSLEGIYETRHAWFAPIWSRFASPDFPYRASYLRDDDAAYQAAYAATYGAGVFSDPTGDTWIVRVCAKALVFSRETEIGRIIPFKSGLTVSAPVIVEQNFNELIIARGRPLTSLRWSGDWTNEVQELVPSNIESGYADVPPADYVLPWRERTVLLSGDNVILTRIADSTQYHATNGIIFVNRGRGDVARAAAELGSYSLLVLKSQSAHVLTYIKSDLSDVRVDPQPLDIQFDSPRTLVTADNKVWWLDRRGVRTAQVVEVDSDNKIRLQVDVVSDKIIPLIQRIAWRYASQFTAVVTERRIYFAVALDTQTTPQTLLVFNRITGEWESYDQWDTDTLTDFHVLEFAPAIPWLNEPRLFAIDGYGRIACAEFNQGEDIVGWNGTTAVRAAIADELVTRAFTAGRNDPKRVLRAQVQVDTWNPAVQLVAIFDGPGESQDIGSITTDPTKFTVDLPRFVLNNADGRFHVAKRQDYSVALGSSNPLSGYATWTPGTSYDVNALIYRDANGHNYRAAAPSVGELSNVPDRSPLIWKFVRADDDQGGSRFYDPVVDDAAATLTSSSGDNLRTSHAPIWTVGKNYVAGDSVGYNGLIYTCLVPNTAAIGTRPEDNVSLWTDLGLDASVKTGALYLQNGIRLEDFQTMVKRAEIKREASWCQIAIRGTQGANKIRSVSLETIEGQRSNITHV